MNGAEVTFDLGWLIVVFFIPVIAWLIRRIGTLEKEFTDYQLSAEQRFASVSHLQEVEKRLTDAIEGLRVDLKDFTRAMNGFVSRAHGD